jgi:hypothetical protein
MVLMRYCTYFAEKDGEPFGCIVVDSAKDGMIAVLFYSLLNTSVSVMP